MSEAIFKTISQAIYVAFAMEIIPATSKSTTQIVIEDLMRSCGKVFDPVETSINAKGMSALEFRGQCSIIRGNVEALLLAPERDALWARYGQVDKDFHVFRKSKGIDGLSLYLEPICNIKGDALKALLWNFYWTDKKQKPPSLRDISDEFEVPKTNLIRTKQIIGRYGAQLEMKAFQRLSLVIKAGDMVQYNEIEYESII